MLRVIAPAKVNLFLGIGPSLPDGYHSLISVFHALELADEITIQPFREMAFECDVDLGVPAEMNLAYRAAIAFGSAVGREPSVRISVRKKIPHGAGLGGGSSDAAAVITGLAHMWDIDPRDPRCWQTAASLGADVPFFLNGGAALMSGRGDVLVRTLPALHGAPVVLVKPPCPVSTADAYRAFDEAPAEPGDPDDVVAALEATDERALATALRNNMERASSAVVPQVAEALAWTRRASGVHGAIVAGSGSAIFGMCAHSTAAQLVAANARERGWWSEATRLVAHGAAVVQ